MLESPLLSFVGFSVFNFPVKYQSSFKSSKLVVNWLFSATLNPLKPAVLGVFEDNHRDFSRKTTSQIEKPCPQYII